TTQAFRSGSQSRVRRSPSPLIAVFKAGSYRALTSSLPSESRPMTTDLTAARGAMFDYSPALYLDTAAMALSPAFPQLVIHWQRIPVEKSGNIRCPLDADRDGRYRWT